jgi:hypothetical protein
MGVTGKKEECSCFVINLHFKFHMAPAQNHKALSSNLSTTTKKIKNLKYGNATKKLE